MFKRKWTLHGRAVRFLNNILPPNVNSRNPSENTGLLKVQALFVGRQKEQHLFGLGCHDARPGGGQAAPSFSLPGGHRWLGGSGSRARYRARTAWRFPNTSPWAQPQPRREIALGYTIMRLGPDTEETLCFSHYRRSINLEKGSYFVSLDNRLEILV